MKNKLLIVASAFLLAGCFGSGQERVEAGVTPVQIPDLPPNLAKKAERLPDITDPSMGGQVLAGIEAETKYNDVAYEKNALIDLYNCVKETVNEEKDPTKCLSSK